MDISHTSGVARMLLGGIYCTAATVASRVLQSEKVAGVVVVSKRAGAAVTTAEDVTAADCQATEIAAAAGAAEMARVNAMSAMALNMKNEPPVDHIYLRIHLADLVVVGLRRVLISGIEAKPCENVHCVVLSSFGCYFSHVFQNPKCSHVKLWGTPVQSSTNSGRPRIVIVFEL